MSEVFERAKPVAHAILELANSNDNEYNSMIEEMLGPCLAIYRNESDFYPTALNNHGAHPTYAAGITQVVKSNWPSFGLGGDVETRTGSAFRVKENVQQCMKHLNIPHYKLIKQLDVELDIQLVTALLYIGHAEGGGPLRSALKMMEETQTYDFETACFGVARDWATKRSRANGFYNSPEHMWEVGSYAQWWAEQRHALLNETEE